MPQAYTMRMSASEVRPPNIRPDQLRKIALRYRLGMPNTTAVTAMPARKRQSSNAVVNPSPSNIEMITNATAPAVSSHGDSFGFAAITASIVSPGLNHTESQGERLRSFSAADVIANLLNSLRSAPARRYP